MRRRISISGTCAWFVSLSLFCVTVFTANAWAGFTKIDTGLPGVYGSAGAWGDYDNDGDLDAIFVGEYFTSVGTLGDTYIARNDGNDVFTVLDEGLSGYFLGLGLVWGDYDNDGDLDILAHALTGPKSGACDIWRNDGGDFNKINTGFQKLVYPFADWGDYDNDGDLDVLYTGFDWDWGNFTELWRNDGNDTFTKIISGLPDADFGAVAWGDYDNDGDLDILIANFFVPGSDRISDVFRNDGNDTFTRINAGLPNIVVKRITWGDYDNDGDLDLLTLDSVYRNNGDDSFTDINAGLAVGDGIGVWGDFDNNGYLDVFKGSIIYLNNGNGTFTSVNTGLPQVSAGTAVSGDYDNDGDLDIILTGGDFHSTSVTEIWRNDGGWDGFAPNTPPTAPTNLQHNENTGRYILFWDPSFDYQTPVDGLSYNIWIGTSPDKMDILSPMADGTTGLRMIPAMGNTGPNPFFMFDGALPSDTAYYWKVQAVDTAFAGSEWSETSWFGAIETLTVIKNGNGSGTITSDLAGIDCGGDCVSEFPINGMITLTAVPDAHSRFIGWCGGDCHGTGPCEVTMDQSRTVLAMFIKRGPGWWGGWPHRYRPWSWFNWRRPYWKWPGYYHYVWWGGWRHQLPH